MRVKGWDGGLVASLRVTVRMVSMGRSRYLSPSEVVPAGDLHERRFLDNGPVGSHVTVPGGEAAAVLQWDVRRAER